MTITEDEKKKLMEAIEIVNCCGDRGFLRVKWREILAIKKLVEFAEGKIYPPLVDGDLAKALLWLENTKRHLDEQGRMEEMLYCEALLQAATSQQVREWDEDALEVAVFSELENLYGKVRAEEYLTAMRCTLSALAAKNIIRLKDGGVI